MDSLSDDYLFVVAIDFGTTYSGYAYSSRSDFKSNPLKIVANQVWNAGSHRHMSLKTPTCLLLDDKENLVSFGYEAENEYSDIVSDGRQNEYFFFQRFKMQLYKDEKVKSDMKLEDVSGKPLSAMKVFSESIKALTKHLFCTFEERGIEIKRNEIRYVLTVPAIWTDAAKQFMRKSANMAGIENNQLVIALEPEAASIYCQYLPTEKLHGAEKGFTMSAPGTEYMVVDLGGGTADITIHKKHEDGSLKELCRASGRDCGGTSIDAALLQIFVKLFGGPLINIIKKENPGAFLEIFREFEAVKRTIDANKKGKVNIAIPRAFLDEVCKKHLGEDLPQIIEHSTLKKQLEVKYDKLKIESELLVGFLGDAAMTIKGLLLDILKQNRHINLKLIVMVGGFSYCKIIQEEIKTTFPRYKVVVPEDADLAVLKGAVLFGQRPNYITSRILRYTYGIRTRVPFDPKRHAESRRVVDAYGKVRCKDGFSRYAQIDSEVVIGKEHSHSHYTTNEFQRKISFEVFRSESKSPVYADEEGSVSIGKLVAKIPNPSKEKRELRVSIIFGNTELTVTAVDRESGEKCETSFDLI